MGTDINFRDLLWPTVRVEAFYGSQVIIGILAQIWLTVGQLGPSTHPMLISPVPECVVVIKILCSWENLYIDSLTYEVRAIVVAKENESH